MTPDWLINEHVLVYYTAVNASVITFIQNTVYTTIIHTDAAYIILIDTDAIYITIIHTDAVYIQTQYTYPLYIQTQYTYPLYILNYIPRFHQQKYFVASLNNLNPPSQPSYNSNNNQSHYMTPSSPPTTHLAIEINMPR